MGGQTSKKSQVELNIDHPKFSNVKVVTEGDNRYLQTTMGVDEKANETWEKELKQSKVSHYHLLLPIKRNFTTKGLCGSSGTLTLNFQDYPYLLSQQIYHRHGQKSRFQQTELWFLLYNLVAAKRDFAHHSPKLGDIRPRNIFINQGGDIKVSNLLSWPNQGTNDQKAFQGVATYLAPEEVSRMQNGPTQIKADGQSQVFSIGLTLLSSALLYDYEDLYSFDKGGCLFNQNRFLAAVTEFKNTAYSEIFRGTVSNLVSLDPSKRVSFDELLNWVQDYRQKILAKQNFIITKAPNKFHEEVLSIRSAGFGPKNLYQAQQAPIINHPSVIPIQSQTDTSKINFDGNVKPAESLYTPIPAQLQGANQAIGSHGNIQVGSSNRINVENGSYSKNQ